MRKEITVLILALILVGILGATSVILNNIHRPAIFNMPLGDSFSVFSFLRKEEKPKNIVYGYLPYWSLDKIENFQLDKLTDIAYFGLSITADGGFDKSEPGYKSWQSSENLTKLISASKKHHVRFALTVISHDDAISDAFLNCPKCWDTFITNLQSELNNKKIKDVNLNFEYSDLTSQDKADKYTQFVQLVNQKMHQWNPESFVVVATFADSTVKPRVTNISDLAKVTDALFIMAYDFHQPSSDKAGPVAPMHGAGVSADYDITKMLQDYLAVAPASKLILGVPYYGYNWVVSTNSLYPTRIPGNDYIGYSQSQTYSDIMETIIENKPNIKWDSLSQVPYFTYISPSTGSLRSVYYENANSLKVKYDLAKDKGLAGIGIWALGYDGGYAELWDLIRDEFIAK
ncbi:MAG TPA: glycosyl hydrolase family 18 protein [Candidatus Saccharimonadales bacterium]|nr:glycosyl hydrolase family 18 protein [Candidatus Saccharimonadales bacterium]